MGIAGVVLAAASAVGSLYLLAAAVAVLRFTAAAPRRTPAGAPVTVLKPLHGEDAGLYDNLRSFCIQDYPAFQIVFGVREADDAAIPVVRRLIAELPERDLALVVDPRVYGTNLKLSNLENMLAVAKHDIFVIADSDMLVRPDYLAAVVAPLEDPGVGLVTCLYRGRPIDGFAARLGAMFVNHGFLPSALVGQWTQPGDACFGATMVLRRSTLDAVGGFAPLRDHLADDYALGAAVRRIGQRIALSTHLVDTIVSERGLAALFRHELRWSRTIRLIAPAGYAATLVTHPVALAACACALGGLAPLPLGALGLALACRAAMVRLVDRALGMQATPLWLLPLRDLLSFVVFVASFLGNKVAWRDRTFRIAADGRLVSDGDTRA